MTVKSSKTHPPKSSLRSVIYATLAAIVMAVALGVGTTLGELLASWLPNSTGFLARLIPAILVTLIASTGLSILIRRGNLAPNQTGLKTSHGILRPMLLGILVAIASASVVVLPAIILGWIRLDLVSGNQLLYFLLTNLIIGLLLEAIPEELTLRGYAYGSLRQRFKKAWAGLCTTILFVIVPGLSTIVSAGLNALTGRTAGHIGIAPQGEDPVSYVILLAVFGSVLIAARTTLSGWPVWTSVGFHITFLTINRLFFAEGRQTGLVAERVSADVVLLVPVYLLLAWLVFNVIKRYTGARSA